MKLKRVIASVVFFIGLSKAAIEWPVFFEHLGFVHSIHNKWDLTISVKLHLPSLEARLSKTVHRLRLLDHQYEKHDPEEPPNEETSTTTSRNHQIHLLGSNEDLSRIEELHESWARLNRHLLHRAQNLQRRGEDLRGLGRPSSKRRKRQDDGGAFGGLLKTLFGVAYAGEVSQVASKLEAIDSRLSSDIGGVRSSHSNLESRTTQELQKHGEVLGHVEKMTHTLERKVADMETNPILKTQLGEIVHSRNEQYQSLQLELDLMEERMGEIERVVLSLSAGKLCKDVLPPKQLSQTLHNIERQLPGNYSMLFPADEPLWPYYSILTATANFDSDLETAVVQVTIPLVDLASILDLNRVHNLPLKVKEGYSVTADIATDYLVTDYSKNYFLELNKEDFQDCQVYQIGIRGQHFYCGLKPMLRGHEARSCVMQLYQGQSDPTWCQSRLRHGLVQPFQRLYNGSWIFSALHEQITVNIACPDGHETVSPLSGFGVIGMAEGCTVTSRDFLYPHTFTGSITLSLNFGDKGWDSAEYLTDVPLNETLFSHNQEYHEEIEGGDALAATFNEVEDNQDTLPFLPQLIEAVQADNDYDLSDVTPSESARSSTTVFTPNNILPTAASEDPFIDIDNNIDDDEDNVDNNVDNDGKVESQQQQEDLQNADTTPEVIVASDEPVAHPLVEEIASSLNTPLFSFLTSTTNAVDVSTESTLSNSVQSGALNVEIPDDVAANKDLTTVKYDLLIKLAEKFKSKNWLQR